MFKNFNLQIKTPLLLGTSKRKNSSYYNDHFEYNNIKGYVLIINVAKNPTIANIYKLNNYIEKNGDETMHDNLIIIFKYLYAKYKTYGTPLAKRNRNKFYYNMYKLYCLLEEIHGFNMIKYAPFYKKITLSRKDDEYFNICPFSM